MQIVSGCRPSTGAARKFTYASTAPPSSGANCGIALSFKPSLPRLSRKTTPRHARVPIQAAAQRRGPSPSPPPLAQKREAATSIDNSGNSTETDAGQSRSSSPSVRPPSRLAGSSSILPLWPTQKTLTSRDEDGSSARTAKRTKELEDRQGYLKNVWYAAALSEKVRSEPVKVQLCGKEFVLWRETGTGTLHCIDNACPHRGAPLSSGWVQEKEGHSCVVCPYHGWAFDGDARLQDVPAAEHKGEWPQRKLLDAYTIEEKCGFVWLFYGSKNLPVDARPPIPFTPELEDPSFKAVYEEMEFEANHFAVFENAIDMAHIHYLHSDSFGNQDAPKIRDMQATSDDPYSVTATFKIQNKPVNAFWALFKVPAVEVTATAFLPSTSVISFTLANGLSFITFVNTVPISATRSVNRFALVRRLSWDKTGLFNARVWDGMARRAMKKILSEDKVMVEQLEYDQLPVEFNVRRLIFYFSPFLSNVLCF